MARISDLPPEVDASLFYKPIKDIQTQVSDKERIKFELEAKQCTHSATQGLNANDVMARVQYAINRLEDASKEDQKAIFENVIQFAEFHPQRLKLSLFVGSTTIIMAELKRFELLYGFHHNTLSKRAPSTARTQLRIRGQSGNNERLF